jgi:hypothetical protein
MHLPTFARSKDALDSVLNDAASCRRIGLGFEGPAFVDRLHDAGTGLR